MAYAIQASVDLLFGANNIDTWADIDGDADAVKMAARKAQSLIVADAEVDDVALLVQYKIPLQTTAAATPTSVADLANRLAGLWLYESYGALEFNPKSGAPAHRYAFMAVRVRRKLEDIRRNQIKLDAVIGG